MKDDSSKRSSHDTYPDVNWNAHVKEDRKYMKLQSFGYTVKEITRSRSIPHNHIDKWNSIFFFISRIIAQVQGLFKSIVFDPTSGIFSKSKVFIQSYWIWPYNLFIQWNLVITRSLGPWKLHCYIRFLISG